MQSSFLVCSSRWEAFGLILIEAMSCGLPVVSFDCDNGPRNIITHGTDGLLARNGDVADLTAKMCQLIESPALRSAMSVEARQQAARYRKETVLRQYAQFYTSIIKSSGAQ
jgi:glycosyltransferase involved in cell wall biosynthesis